MGRARGRTLAPSGGEQRQEAVDQPSTEDRPLLERDDELQAIDHALAELRDTADGVPQVPRGGLLAFTGEAGLGKTTLIAAVRARAAALGFTVFSGKGGENERGMAFRVVRQAMQPILARMGEPERRDFLGSWYDIVGAALGLEATDPARMPDPTGVRDGLDWVMTRLTMLNSPVVLLLDDLHWADAESLDWLASFAPRVANLPLLIVVGYRPRAAPARAVPARRGRCGADHQGRSGRGSRGRVLRRMLDGHRRKPLRGRRTGHQAP
jgi:hypothetical protein